MNKKGTKKAVFAFFTLLILLLILFFVSVNSGSLKVGFTQLIKGLFVEYDSQVATVFDLRFPRIIIAMLAGAALSVSGVLLQAVMKNPLADPGILGISSGASFAAVIITAALPSLYFFTPLFALIGGMAAFFIVYSLSWNHGLSPLRIVLVGVAVNAVFTGLSGAFNSFSGGNLSGVSAIVNGNIAMKTWSDVNTLFWYVLFGLVCALLCAGKCNILMLEDKTVRGLGINVDRVRLLISFVAVLLASISTAIVGSIAFMGLIVPHIARLIIGSQHKSLVPFSMILGAFLLLLTDTLGRTIAAPYEISASILMSVFGGPFFILLLRKSGKTYGN